MIIKNKLFNQVPKQIPKTQPTIKRLSKIPSTLPTLPILPPVAYGTIPYLSFEKLTDFENPYVVQGEEPVYTLLYFKVTNNSEEDIHFYKGTANVSTDINNDDPKWYNFPIRLVKTGDVPLTTCALVDYTGGGPKILDAQWSLLELSSTQNEATLHFLFYQNGLDIPKGGWVNLAMACQLTGNSGSGSLSAYISHADPFSFDLGAINISPATTDLAWLPLYGTTFNVP